MQGSFEVYAEILGFLNLLLKRGKALLKRQGLRISFLPELRLTAFPFAIGTRGG